MQTLWINFTVDLFLAIGLGYGAAASGLMDRKPRAADEAVLPRPLLAWLAVVGFLMGAVTLAITSWANDPHGLALARTMGFTTFALAHIFFAVSTKDERGSVFNLETFADKPLLISIGAASRSSCCRRPSTRCSGCWRPVRSSSSSGSSASRLLW